MSLGCPSKGYRTVSTRVQFFDGPGRREAARRGQYVLALFREALGRPGFANKAGNFFTIGLKGAFMKLALTVATLIALGGGTAHAQQGQLSLGQRDLTPEEQQVIMDAVAPSLRNPGSAKYHWAKFPAVVTEGSVNYCAIVDAQSPYAAYNGRQAYIVETQMSGNRVSSAVIGLIAGGKDFAIVTNMCAKYGLDPRNAS